MDLWKESRYMPNNMYPDCHKHVGGGYYVSELCACFMSDGTHELLRYMMCDDDSSKDKWCTDDGSKLSVVAWLEI